ncbi:heterokaryon incompatibility protein-domain-containing protein [Lasiosphaeria miniovina]|uniref:Heterokaryon incompatibility protein-domain-containing protein n=1 Tax=Lasiosphaeria miniovina TaxID=1954250 RepID=A0AA40E6H6_9PEZI|nr:heterokaryon incompatibility protein-domain-containing protein [Lasiosphaeria miniovina]KAK0726847.1 heterokaryon incompatibility protein-domain-containing protein [Lasiosphaeria miniovina]
MGRLHDIPPDRRYTYEPLPTPTSIRLVSLKLKTLRGQGQGQGQPESVRDGGPIELSMRVVDLEDQPITYEALSYTWGRPVTVFPSLKARDDDGAWEGDVLCDGKVLPITLNLYRYLLEWRHICQVMANPPPHIAAKMATTSLRLPTEMWIDALSINQHDADEKGVQVALMGRIYRQTTKITVWLGHEDVFTRPALELLFKLATTPRATARAARTQHRLPARCTALGLPAWDSSHWWPVFAFLQRAWFRRSWVIQELALAPKAQMQCGTLTFPWEALSNACINLTETGLGEAVDMWAWFEVNGPRLSTPLWDDELNPIIVHSPRPDDNRNLFTTLERRRPSYLALITLEHIKKRSYNPTSVGPRRPPATVQEEEEGQEAQPVPLLQLLDDCRGYDASDPRDKIFAFLGISQSPPRTPAAAHESLRPLRADYHLTAAEAFLQTAWHTLLTTANSLELLSRQSLPHNDDPPSRVIDIASWVPDWSTGPQVRRLVSPAAAKWAASRGLCWVPPEPAKMHQPFLAVHGALVDSVAAVTDTLDGFKFSPTEFAVLTDASGSFGFSLTKSAVVAAELPPRYPWPPQDSSSPDQTPGEVLWRTMAADTIDGTTGPAPAAYHSVFHAAWQRTARRACRDMNSDHGLRDAKKHTEWQRVFESWEPLFPDEVDDAVAEFDSSASENQKERPNLSSGPGRTEGYAELLAASRGVARTKHTLPPDANEADGGSDKYGMWAYAPRPDAKRSQTDRVFDEMLAAIMASLQHDRDVEGRDQEISSIPDQALLSKALQLLAVDTDGDAAEARAHAAQLVALQTELEALAERAAADPGLERALRKQQQGIATGDGAGKVQGRFVRIGNGITELDTDFMIDLSPEKDKLAVAVHGLLRDASGGNWSLERPETPEFDDGFEGQDKEDSSVVSVIVAADAEDREEMAAALTARHEAVSTGRAIFRTEENYLGNGPRSVVPGDQVWVLTGAATPIVLRPLADGRFVLVGEAYVHGIMRGEAFDRPGFSMRHIELA